MRRAALAGFVATILAAAAAAAALAPSGGARSPATLREATQRTAAAGSMRFALTSRIAAVTALRPVTLHVTGATSPRRTRIHLKVADVTDATGARLTGPSADERTDGTFLYLRSTVTRSVAGNLWVRERLATIKPGAPELKTLHRVLPTTILRVLGRARTMSVAGRGTVFHALVPDADAVAQAALRGLDGNTEYRHLRVTAWVDRDGLVRRVRLTGRTADGASTLRLVASLYGFGRPVTLPPLPAGSFVDFETGSLTA